MRRFQTPAEREAEGRAKGYARVLEGSLLRGEERLAKLEESRLGPADPDFETPGSPPEEQKGEADGAVGRGRDGDGDGDVDMLSAPQDPQGIASQATSVAENTTTHAFTAFRSLETEMAAPPRTRAGGRQQWEAYLRDRFIRGGDDDFEYARVDGDDEYDVLERAEQEDAWFDEEDPSWASDSPAASSNSSSGAGAHGRRPVERILTGETGIQDF